MLLSLQALSQTSEQTAIRIAVEAYGIGPDHLVVGGERIYHPDEIQAIYRDVGYDLLWRNVHNSTELLNQIRHSLDEGLVPDDYHYKALLNAVSTQPLSVSEIANFDILLSDAFLTYASHLRYGKTDPEMLFPGKWERMKEPVDLKRVLLDALHSENVHGAMEMLRPQIASYTKLIAALSLQKQSEPKPVIHAGTNLEVGFEDVRIKQVRKYFGLADTTNACYDSILYNEVVEFQRRRGLRADGAIGKQTLAALNEDGSVAIGRIKANLERYRWLPHEMPNEYVVVNLPAYELTVRVDDTATLSMRAIVGRPERSTPVFNSVIRYMIINPTWVVPPTILKEDVWPAVRRDVKYLSSNNLRVVDAEGIEIDPSTLSWEKYTYKNFPYQFRQDPGTYNSMGLIKFQFPNRYSVFLHDTNARYLFAQSYRALSSGCVRIERPFEMALLLLRDTRWTEEKLNNEIASGKPRTIVFDRPMPIYIRYFTIFPDESGIMQIRDDIYGYDTNVSEAVERPLK